MLSIERARETMYKEENNATSLLEEIITLLISGWHNPNYDFYIL